ncbi:hypothetical protein [Nitrosopumilus sp.]|uniref:hypothetical protein n=1 Tax=Nitrosopumilus sp. TaxID=2024843 RepID=UPI00349FD85A
MTAMETLLATPFEKTFRNFVDDDDITKIKYDLFEQYQITLSSSLKEFKKFECVTKKILGDNGVSTIKKTLDKICHLESQPKHKIEIKDETLKNTILDAYDDPLKKHILDVAFDYPLTLWEIAARVKIGSLSLSENISYLIYHGLLTTRDLDAEYNKKYYSTIDDISVKIDENEFCMYATINDISNETP